MPLCPPSQVVLAAGTVESAKIVRLSNLPDPSGKVGRGITDHPVLYTHFGIPPGSPWHQPGACAKVLLQHKDFAAHPYNVVVELGSDFNQVSCCKPCSTGKGRQLCGGSTMHHS